MKQKFEMVKRTTKKIVYGFGITSIIAIALVVVFKLFVYSTPPETPDDDDDYYKQMYKNYILYTPYIPEKLDFCGEEMPIDRFDVYEAVDYEFLKIMYWQSETMLYLKRQKEVFAVVEPILKKNNVPDDFKYLMVAESGMVNVVSPAKAEGYWQFLKQTAIEYGLEINSEVDERYNLEKSTEAACKYLLDSYKSFGNWTLVAASYNAGRDRIRKELTRQKVNSFYDLLLVTETSRYVYRIVVYKEIMENPRKYGFELKDIHSYKLPEYNVIKIDTPIESLIDFAIEYGTNYKILKNLNPWLRDEKLTNSSRKTYYIKVPKQNLSDE